MCISLLQSGRARAAAEANVGCFGGDCHSQADRIRRWPRKHLTTQDQ